LWRYEPFKIFAMYVFNLIIGTGIAALIIFVHPLFIF